MKKLLSRMAGAVLALTAMAASSALAQGAADPVCVTQDIYCQYSYKSTADNPNYLVGLTNALFPPSIFAIGPHSPQTGQASDPRLGIISLDTFYLVLFDGNAGNGDPF